MRHIQARVRRGGDDGDRDDADQEDEIQSRMVNDRNFDTKTHVRRVTTLYNSKIL